MKNQKTRHSDFPGAMGTDHCAIKRTPAETHASDRSSFIIPHSAFPRPLPHGRVSVHSASSSLPASGYRLPAAQFPFRISLSPQSSALSPAVRSAFTMIELVIILCIIGIVAAIVVPRVSFGSQKALAARVAQDLKTVNEAMSLYKRDHNWKYPRFDVINTLTPSDSFKYRLTDSTNKDGSANGPYGPYIKKPFPTNPYISSLAGYVLQHQKTSGYPAQCVLGWYADSDDGTFNIGLSSAKITLPQLEDLAAPAPVLFDKPMD